MGVRDNVYLHHDVLRLMGIDLEQGQLTDHRDGDGLNCSRENLRISTASGNNRNRGPNRAGACRLKGVSIDRRHRKYRAQIYVAGKRMYLGLYDTEEAAAQAYDAAARLYFGEYARLNFPDAA